VRQPEAVVGVEDEQLRQAAYENENNWRKDRSDALDRRTVDEQEILKAKKRRELQSLVSPINGTVTNLAAWAVGGVVKPGDTIMNIVPLSATPELEIMALNKDIGFIAVGQLVAVKFDAFPFTRYGTVKGEVIDVSRDSNKDDKRGLVYPVMLSQNTDDLLVRELTLLHQPSPSETDSTSNWRNSRGSGQPFQSRLPRSEYPSSKCQVTDFESPLQAVQMRPREHFVMLKHPNHDARGDPFLVSKASDLNFTTGGLGDKFPPPYLWHQHI
jgi:hypothetical protein